MHWEFWKYVSPTCVITCKSLEDPVWWVRPKSDVMYQLFGTYMLYVWDISNKEKWQMYSKLKLSLICYSFIDRIFFFFFVVYILFVLFCFVNMIARSKEYKVKNWCVVFFWITREIRSHYSRVCIEDSKIECALVNLTLT